MRICIVTVAGHGIGGMQDHTRSLARGLVDTGHDVDVVTTRHPEGTRTEDGPNGRWHFVDAAHHHPWLPRRDPAWLMRSFETFERLHGEHPFDVVHSESASAIGLVRRGVHRRVPLTAKFHGNALAFARAAFQRAARGGVREKVKEAKGLVWLLGQASQYGHWYRFRPCVWSVPSLAEFEDTRRCCFLQRSLGHVVPNGVDSDLFRPRPRDEVRRELALGDMPLFVAIGRLNGEKGMDKAIEALARLEGRGSGAQLVIVGEGEEREALEALAHTLGVRERVLFCGAQPHDVVARYLAAGDSFLFPTVRGEAAPLVLPQAMSCGVAVIASAIGGIPEVIQHSGENGILVRPGDVDQLVTAMQAVVEGDDLRRRLGEAARRRVLEEYTVERMVDRTLTVYRHAVSHLAPSATTVAATLRRG